MKGLIVYSSLTGNTKKMAEKLQAGLSDLGEWTVSELKENPDPSGYDRILVGSWIDRAMLDKKTLAWLQSLPDVPLGLFGTLGAMPESFHGERVKENLGELLKDRKGLGVFILPGLVDAQLLARVRAIPEHVMAKEIRDQMVEAGEKSRWATEEEYQTAVAYFRTRLQERIKNG